MAGLLPMTDRALSAVSTTEEVKMDEIMSEYRQDLFVKEFVN